MTYSPLHKYGGESGVHQNNFSDMAGPAQRKQVWAPEGDFALSAFELAPVNPKKGNISDTLYYNPEGYNNVKIDGENETLQVIPYPIDHNGKFIIGNYYEYVALEYVVGDTPTKPPEGCDFPEDYWDEVAKKEKRTKRRLWAHDEHDYAYIVQQNNGVTPYRTGRMKLKTKYTFREKVPVDEQSVFFRS